MNELVTNIDSTPQLKQFDLDSLPVICLSDDGEKAYIDIVNRIIELKKSEGYYSSSAKHAQAKDYENQIDQMVYGLYGLTEDEVNILKGQIN